VLLKWVFAIKTGNSSVPRNIGGGQAVNNLRIGKNSFLCGEDVVDGTNENTAMLLSEGVDRDTRVVVSTCFDAQLLEDSGHVIGMNPHHGD